MKIIHWFVKYRSGYENVGLYILFAGLLSILHPDTSDIWLLVLWSIYPVWIRGTYEALMWMYPQNLVMLWYLRAMLVPQEVFMWTLNTHVWGGCYYYYHSASILMAFQFMLIILFFYVPYTLAPFNVNTKPKKEKRFCYNKYSYRGKTLSVKMCRWIFNGIFDRQLELFNVEVSDNSKIISGKG